MKKFKGKLFVMMALMFALISSAIVLQTTAFGGQVYASSMADYEESKINVRCCQSSAKI